MTGFSFRSELLKKNSQACKNYIKNNLGSKNIVPILRDLIFLSILAKIENKSKVHPIIIINIIKNLIGDNKNRPSKILIIFFIDYILKFELRKNDKNLLENALRGGISSIAFIGDLEDAYQNNQWKKAELMVAKSFLASDNSRGVFDVLTELALQDINKNGVFIFHLLRSYQFYDRKEDNWAFTRCIMSRLLGDKLPNPHKHSQQNPNSIKNKVLSIGDLTLFSSMERIWEGDYVRIKGYRREISNWCLKIRNNDFTKIKINVKDWVFGQNKNRFITHAELIVLKKDKSKNQKINDLIVLESMRALLKNINLKQLSILKKRFN